MFGSAESDFQNLKWQRQATFCRKWCPWDVALPKHMLISGGIFPRTCRIWKKSLLYYSGLKQFNEIIRDSRKRRLSPPRPLTHEDESQATSTLTRQVQFNPLTKIGQHAKSQNARQQLAICLASFGGNITQS